VGVVVVCKGGREGGGGCGVEWLWRCCCYRIYRIGRGISFWGLNFFPSHQWVFFFFFFSNLDSCWDEGM